MKNKVWLTTLLLLVSFVLGTGCAPLAVGTGAAAGGAGTYAYLQGELQSRELVSMETAWYAAEAALEDMGMSVRVRETEAVESRLEARGTRDERVSINLRRLADDTTEVGVRVGMFGDENLSRTILERIRRFYDTAPPTDVAPPGPGQPPVEALPPGESPLDAPPRGVNTQPPAQV